MSLRSYLEALLEDVLPLVLSGVVADYAVICEDCEEATDLLYDFLMRSDYKISEYDAWMFYETLQVSLVSQDRVRIEYVSDTGTCEMCEGHSDEDEEVALYQVAMVLQHRLSFSTLIVHGYDVDDPLHHRTVSLAYARQTEGFDGLGLQFRHALFDEDVAEYNADREWLDEDDPRRYETPLITGLQLVDDGSPCRGSPF